MIISIGAVTCKSKIPQAACLPPAYVVTQKPSCYNKFVKEKIHPKYQTVNVTCACGAEFEIGSTKDKVHVDICSRCHPLFTGKQKLMDTEGRIDKFKKKYTGKTLAPKIKKVRTVKKSKTIKTAKPAKPAKKSK